MLVSLASLDAQLSFPLFVCAHLRVRCGARFVIGWTTICMLPFFFVLLKSGFFRVRLEIEMAGMDTSEHGGGVY